MSWTLGERLAYRGKKGCRSGRCTRRNLIGDEDRCFGWHCANCDQPSSYQGHTELHGDKVVFTCEPPTQLEEP